MSRRSERGASAVEFAILLPVLVALVFGIIEFGRAYNAQITLTHAAREGVRTMAITNNPTAAKDRTVQAAAGSGLTTGQVAVTVSTGTGACVPGATTTVKASRTFSTLTGIIDPYQLTGRGVMRCGG